VVRKTLVLAYGVQESGCREVIALDVGCRCPPLVLNASRKTGEVRTRFIGALVMTGSQASDT
jgi:hypothetical protein